MIQSLFYGFAYSGADLIKVTTVKLINLFLSFESFETCMNIFTALCKKPFVMTAADVRTIQLKASSLGAPSTTILFTSYDM